MTIQNNFETLKFEKRDDFALLTLNRPDKLNALNNQVLGELKSLLTSLCEDPQGLQGMVFTGAGEKAFIAGADIAEMSDMNTSEAREFGSLGQDVTLLLEKLPFPVVAAVNGFALGGGCEMAMACDFIYATESAIFGQPEVKLGLIPGFGGTQRLSKLVGRNRAKELVYSGRNLMAQEAKNWGLVVNLYGSKDELIEASFGILKQMAKASPHAISLAKKVMNEGNDLTVKDGLAKELEQFSAIFSSDDMREGTKAFVEKRKPNFTGK